MGEFELIQRYFMRVIQDSNILLGIGDDAAALKVPRGEVLLTCTDTLVAGRHFPEITTAYDIGWKSLAVNLSDIAAMGGMARWATLALTLPVADPTWLEGFAKGFFALAQQYGVSLVGGDTTCGPLSITVNLLGTTQASGILRRDGARSGDAVYVSGYPGEAAWVLERILRDEPVGELRCRLDRPEPRMSLGRYLRGRASAAIDISDGLVQDLDHILRASGVGATLDVARLPQRGADIAQPSLQHKLAGGDDYELLFTLPSGQQIHDWEQEPVLTCIGHIDAEPGQRWLGLPHSEFIGLRGYQHF
ncbi:MAG: thiamine-phosphate kinase [Pseudomonadales bacterium]|nr:thiamine-phosphate kinase [Pseudomonadales bacterium]